MPAFSFENISPSKPHSPQAPTILKMPKRPKWVHRYRWPLAVLTLSLPLFLALVALKLATG